MQSTHLHALCSSYSPDPSQLRNTPDTELATKKPHDILSTIAASNSEKEIDSQDNLNHHKRKMSAAAHENQNFAEDTRWANIKDSKHVTVTC